MQFYELYTRQCAILQGKEQLRHLVTSPKANTTPYLDFSSNDYLNFSNAQELKKSAYEAAQEFGIGSTGSRLLSGNYELISKLETQIAKDKGTESALIFNSGYQANISVLPTLLDCTVLGAQALVFCDRLNHSSIYQGILLAKAKLVRYHHNDMQHLRLLLQEHREDLRPKFIVAETLYGMDGDIAPLTELVELAQTYSAFLYLDEAHATGILGPKGYGLSTTIDMQRMPHLIMGTFSKALGAFGAYIACHRQLKQYIVNRCPGFIYSTALPPMVVGAVNKAWSMISKLNQERKCLLQLAQHLREQLIEAGFNIGASTTHIIPIILGGEVETMRARDFLAQHHILVSTVRPPTVSPASSRLRIAITLKHSEHDILRLIEVLKQL